MTNLIAACLILKYSQAANNAGDIKVFTDYIQAGLRGALFPVMHDAMETDR